MATELAELLDREVPFLKAIDWKAYPDPRTLQELAANTALSLCFLDMETDREQGFRILAQHFALPGRLPVVVLLADKNPDLILRCLRQGAGGFLLQPFSADQLRLALARFLDRQSSPPDSAVRRGEVYCVVPAKGGCGATTVAVNLACQANQLGTAKVLLADMDPLTSPLAFLLKLKSQYSFVDALMHSPELDGDLWKALVTPYQGIDVLLAPESPAETSIEACDPDALVDYARHHYELVVLDTGGPYGKWNARLAALSDELLLVTTADLPPLFGAQRALAYLASNGVDRTRIRLIVNQYRRDVGLDLEDVSAALRVPVFHLLPGDDQTIGNAHMDGRAASPNSRFAKSLASLASRLHGGQLGQEQRVPRKKLLSLFSR